jgi:hypothetical protein
MFIFNQLRFLVNCVLFPSDVWFIFFCYLPVTVYSCRLLHSVKFVLLSVPFSCLVFCTFAVFLALTTAFWILLLHSVNCLLLSIHYLLLLLIIYWLLYIVYCCLYIIYGLCTLFTLFCTLFTAFYTLSLLSFHCSLFSTYCLLFSGNYYCILSRVFCFLYIAYCFLYALLTVFTHYFLFSGKSYFC